MSSSEVAPLVKVGGLADVVGALPLALEALGHDVRVVCPLYGCIERKASFKRHTTPLTVHLNTNETAQARVWETTLPNSQVRVYLIEKASFFGRREVYDGPWGAHEDNDLRYAFLSRATLDLCNHIGWMPDIFHVHDWPTALVPVLLHTCEATGPLGKVPSVLTIHNLQHQGMHHERALDYLGLPRWLFSPRRMEAMGALNLLKGGIYHASKITTVSRTYAQEIQTPEHGFGLDHLLRARREDLVGIVNGIDIGVCNPQTDPLIPFNFSAQDLSGKAQCKAQLQKTFNLEVNPEIPVFSAVARLYWQKGLDILADIAAGAVENMRIQLIVLGSGDPGLEERFRQLASRYPGKIGVYIGYKPQLAHLTQAGSNFFIMPSRFEPCGLTQLYAMRYGSVPLVRETGGLIDTVQQYNEATSCGTGLRFKDLSPSALYNTLGWACSTYYDRPNAYKRLQMNGLTQDFSWTQPALDYQAVYQAAQTAQV